MSDIGKWVFGGSESKSKPVDLTPAAFAGLQGPLAATLQSTFQNPPAYSGELVAPIPQTALEMFPQLAQMGGGQGGEMLGRILSGEFLAPNPYLDAAIRAAQRPTLEGLTETLDRTLPGRFTQAGQFVQPRGSSAFDRAAAIATRGAASALGDIATNMSFQGYNAGLQQLPQAIQLGQQEVQTFVKNLETQLLPQMIMDLGPQRAQAQFNETTKALLQALQIATSAASPTIANTAKSDSTTGLLPAVGSIVGGRGSQQKA